MRGDIQMNVHHQKSMSRRTFLALSGMTGLAGLFSPSLLTSAWSATGEAQAFSSHFFGPFRTQIKNGRIVSTVAGPATYLGVLSGSLFQEFIHPA